MIGEENLKVDDVSTDLKTLLKLLNEFFDYKYEMAYLWLSNANRLLGGIAPLEMIAQGRLTKLLAFVKAQIEENKADE